MAYTFTRLSEKEFDSFTDEHNSGSFLQSSAMGARRRLIGWTPHYVALKDDAGSIVAAALLSSRPVAAGFSDFECSQGPVLDYQNTELVRVFFTELKRYLRSSKALSLLFNPKVLLNHRDADARIIDDGYDGTAVVDELTSLGFRHLPNADVDQNPLYLRWYFAKDLSDITDENLLLKSFDQQAVRSVKKNLKNHVHVRDLQLSEVETFFTIMKETGERRGFDYRDEEYYRSLGENFGLERVHFKVAELDVANYANHVRAQREQDQKLLEKAEAELAKDETSAKAQNKLNAARQQFSAGESKLAELKALEDEGARVVLAAALFIRYAQEVVFLAGGSVSRYSHFYASYALHFGAMKEAIGAGINRYNFYGTKGDFSNNPEQDGVYRFKRGFGGAVEEQVGYFTWTPYPMLQRIRGVLTRLIRH